MTFTKIKYYLHFLWLILVIGCSSENSTKNQFDKLGNSTKLSDYIDFAYKNQNSRFGDSACFEMSKLIQTQRFNFLKLESECDSITGDIELVFKEIDLSAPYVPFKLKNSLTIQITNEPSIIIWDKKSDFKSITNRAKEFLTNPQDAPNLSEKTVVEVRQIGTVEKPLGHLIIQADYLQKHNQKSDWKYLFKTVEEVRIAYRQIWDEFSKARWNKHFEQLEISKKMDILKVYPYQIELHFDKFEDNIAPPTIHDLKEIQINND